MLTAIKSLFLGDNTESAHPSEHGIQLATAALLFEVMTIDLHHHDAEIQAIKQLLHKTFDLDDQELQQLLSLAQQESAEATSLYQFTKIINGHFDHNEKQQLMVNLWRVAMADGVVDKHEEAIIRRISELIHIRHSEFIQAKQLARDV